MKSLLNGFKAIYRNDRKIIVMMGVLLLTVAGLVTLCIANLRPGSAVVKVGYSDIGAYRDGKWYYMFSFIGLGGILGVMHSLLAVKMYEKKGASAAMLLLVTSIGITLGAIMYMAKLLGEG